ncbi:MAG: hypothetical protein BGO86_11980 [Chryseobacterium sp. 36-9]|nr:MAG: hypothetical protein BGO86_11980 [Chryseobacterium sp. 36-9]
MFPVEGCMQSILIAGQHLLPVGCCFAFALRLSYELSLIVIENVITVVTINKLPRMNLSIVFIFLSLKIILKNKGR